MNPSPRRLPIAMLAALAAPAALAGERLPPPTFAAGGGLDARSAPHDEMAPFERANIEQQLARNEAMLRALGRLPAPGQAGALDALAWPLRARPGHRDPDYHGIAIHQ